MSRPTELDLTTSDHRWRDVPMPGANQGVQVVPLASAGPTFTILTRFPAGFERATPGGYSCAEEFLVLDGRVELEGRSYVRGDLTVVPSHHLRTRMTSTEGCLVIAWFGGPAEFRSPAELGDGGAGAGIETVHLDALMGDDVLVTAEARWSIGAQATGEDEDGVDLGLTRWWHGVGAAPAASDLRLRRTPIR